MSFHSISFPSEWGGGGIDWQLDNAGIDVSIQLVSPASGESVAQGGVTGAINIIVSIQLVSPASGELMIPGFY